MKRTEGRFGSTHQKLAHGALNCRYSLADRPGRTTGNSPEAVWLNGWEVPFIATCPTRPWRDIPHVGRREPRLHQTLSARLKITS